MKKYKYYTNDELKNFCRERGLKITGKKNDLVHRLLSDDESKTKIADMFRDSDNTEYQAKQSKTVDTISKSTSSVTNYLLHLNSANLSNYFGFGHFYPLALEESKIYKDENRIKDILSAFDEYIIVAKAPINKFDNSDVLVELVLNGIEVNEFENSGLFYISEPIPVSRVKSIYFKTMEAKVSFLSSVKTFPDSFVPSFSCDIISEDNFKPKEIDLDKITLPQNETLSEWKDKLVLFDKVLGLFAFIKNAGILYAERRNKFENVTDSFFSTLNLINPIKQLSSFKENAYLRPLLNNRNFEINSVQREIFKSIIELVYANKAFNIKDAITILENASSRDHPKNGELTDVKEQIDLFRQLKNLTISYKGVLHKEVMKKTQNLPVLALLFLSKFSNKSRQHTDKQAVRNSFIESEFDLPLNSAEYVLGVLGLYYGYKNMIKQDTNLKFSDSNFERLAASTQSIKFKLESYFERFIIESAFQFAVQQEVLTDSFDFLNWSEEMSERSPIALSPNYQYEYSDNSTTVMGQKILKVIRQDKADKVFERIANQYSDQVEITSYLAAFFAKHFKLDKCHILDILKKNKGRYSMNELEDVLNLDSKTRKK